MTANPEPRKTALIYFGCFACGSVFAWISLRPFVPGAWLAEDDGLAFAVAPTTLLTLILILVMSGRYFLSGRRCWAMLASWIIAIAAIVVPRFFISDVLRYQSERASYHAAVRDKKSFGDQYEQLVDGRILVYWRWFQYGVDNAFGIMYDPEDRLAVNSKEDEMAFERFTHGRLFLIYKLEPHWYYVVHS